MAAEDKTRPAATDPSSDGLAKTRLLVIGLVIVVLAELIGSVGFSLGPGEVTLLPMLWALLMAAAWGAFHRRLPQMVSVGPRMQGFAGAVLGVGIMLFLSRMGFTVGRVLPSILDAGPALIFQELGHFFGTIIVGLPIALLIGMKREAIGATFSIGRESSLMIVGERYGLDSAEGRGVLGAYVTGTVLGALFLATFAGFIASLGLFDPRSLAMGAGVGSASMMAAAMGAILPQVDPALAQQLTGIAAIANLLTGLVGFYFTMLISLPLTAWLYEKLEPVLGRLSSFGRQPVAEGAAIAEDEEAARLRWPDILMSWGFVIIGTTLANKIGYGVPIIDTLLGFAVIVAPVALVTILKRFLPKMPEIVVLSVLTAFFAFPGLFPFLNTGIEAAMKVDFLAFTTPILALAGFSVAKSLPLFRQLGWRIVVVALVVEIATFMGAVFVAELFH